MKVLVTDAHYNHTLAAVRGLGKEGVDITACSENKFSISFYSKYCNHKLIYPSPLKTPERFIEFLLKKVKQNKYDVIIPIGLHTTRLLSFNKDKFTKFTELPIVDYEIFMKAYNKYETLKIASKIGVKCPKTIIPKDINEVKRISEDINYPVVLKTDKEGGKIAYANSSEELISKYSISNLKFHGLNEKYRYMIQEYIPGNIFGFFALFNNSKPRAIFIHKRIREYPITGGPSTLRESIKNADVKKAGLKILKALKWHGVAMVEFKLDSRDKKPKLMEVNPKFWGSLALSIASGINFPYMLCKMATEKDVETKFDYKSNIRCRWFLGDILYVLSYLRSSRPNKLKVLKEFMKLREKNMFYDDLSSDDPLPALAEFTTLPLSKVLSHLMR